MSNWEKFKVWAVIIGLVAFSLGLAIFGIFRELGFALIAWDHLFGL